MTKLVKVVLHFFGKAYVPAHKNHKGTLVKAHIRTFQRRSKSGQMVTVQEHEDKRQAARPRLSTGRRLGRPDHGAGQAAASQPDQPMQTARPELQPVEPAKPGELEAWLHKMDQEPDIQQAMREVSEGTSTHLLYRQEDGTYTPERQRLHDEILASMLNPRAVAQEGQRPHVAILMGAPASGKTTALQPAAKELGVEFTVINADDVKAKLPEYNGRNAGLVHEESSDIAEGQLLPKAIESGHNVLLDITGANGEKVKGMVERFHKLGYEISILYAHLPIEKACARAVDRFRKSGRFVPPRYIAMKVDGNPEQTYNELKNDPRVTHWRRYSTDVEQGQGATLQEKSGPQNRFGKSRLSVGEGFTSLRQDGRDAQRQDPRVLGSHPSDSSPVARAERVCANLRKSISYLDLDLSSPDLSGSERGVLLAERLDRLEKLEQLESLLEQAVSLHKSFHGHAGRPGLRGGSRPLHAPPDESGRDPDVKEVMQQETRSARRANPKLTEEEEEKARKKRVGKTIVGSALEAAKRERWTKQELVERIGDRLATAGYSPEEIKAIVGLVRRLR